MSLGGPGGDDPPEGFAPLAVGGNFMAHNGPLYVRMVDGRAQLGFRVQARHTNPLNICHGGMLASFGDMLLPVCIHRQSAEVGLRFLARSACRSTTWPPCRWAPGCMARPM